MLLAAGAQAAFGSTGRRTDFCEIQRLKNILRQKFLKAANDFGVVSAGMRCCYGRVLVKASHQDVDDLVLDCPNDFSMGQALQRLFGKLAELLMQVAQPSHLVRIWTNQASKRGCIQFAAAKGLAG